MLGCSLRQDFIISQGFTGENVARVEKKRRRNHTRTNPSPLPQQWYGSSGQASLPHLKLKELQMSASRELSNITSSMYQLLHHSLCILFYFFLFHFVWRIAKIPKTATVTSPICQALRWARSPGHLCCFLFSFRIFFSFFFTNEPTGKVFLFFLWGQGSEL